MESTAGSAEHVAADERRMLEDEEQHLLRLALELDRLDPARQLSLRTGARTPPPLGPRRHPHGRAVTLDEIGGAAVVRRLREQHTDRLPLWIEIVVRRQEGIDQRHFLVGLDRDDR